MSAPPVAPAARAVSHSPRTGAPLRSVPVSSEEQVEEITGRAQAAAAAVAAASPARRRTWLYALADALAERSAELVALADEETALGPERLGTELARTVAQTRFYGDVAVEGSFLGLARDPGTCGAGEAAGLVRINRPLGPVAVFGASNFPFVLGAVGHDPGSAIAAGCPVVVKAHDAHIGLSLRLSAIAEETLAAAGAPAGSYGTVVGLDAGRALVRSPAIRAVAFTGSQRGGLALWRLANGREAPIPVYAEMGTVNPVVVTAAALPDLDAIAEGFVACYTASGGQFCSKPGLLFAPAGSGATDRVARALRRAAPAPTMLTAAIADGVRSGLAALDADGVRAVYRVEADADGQGDARGWTAPAAVLSAPISAVRPGARVLEECFGAVAVVVEYAGVAELVTALETLQPALVAAVWSAPDPLPDPEAAVVVETLAARVGRVVRNGWTTGALPGWAQNHGGPWPATSNAAATSIGATALDRFVRPVAYQGVPDALLPEAARADNPWSISRRVDGRLEPAPDGVRPAGEEPR